jgi:2-amino-4-hydroxy-6-hydroxymethyldihydropteridine diphosphokinase
MMKSSKVYLSLGTNIGDRRRNIEEALRLLDEGLGVHWNALSTIIESKSWGFQGGDFLNCAVCYDCSLSPRGLLGLCKDIEHRMGRREKMEFNPDGSRIYHDRIIDIDILLYGDLTLDEPDLRIPHPKMREREFIMGPLMEIFG